MQKFTRAAVSVMSGVALTATVTLAAEMPASAAGCDTTFSRYGTVKVGSSGTQARGAQCLLDRAGYAVRADGSFSSRDASQLKRFQGRHSISRTGKVDARSWTALLARGTTPTLHVGSRGAAVKRLQKALTASGRPVPATGYFGPITKAAVKSVQRAKGLRATGTATKAVWRALQKGSAVGKAPSRAAAKPAANRVVRASVSSSRSGSKGARALAYAKRQLGDRYVFGATGPHSWDCSGLTMKAWKSVGVNLPHSSRQQFKRGKSVSRSQLRPGDLVFFYSPISHVAIYAGGGKVVHASRRGRPVNVGKISHMPYRGARRMG
ncbi:MAG TPA: peptidoglycan-binding protein [Propionibacteriaceae bacterium]|nr:peptidoglycan-binding protein [Propionibacteriaceae bacterium]